MQTKPTRPAIPTTPPLVTNSFDLTGCNTVSLDFAAAFQIYINPDDYFAVEISTDNGATWTGTVVGYKPQQRRRNVSLDSAYAGNADVQARFRYYGEGWNWWAQVDDVALTCEAGGGDPLSMSTRFTGRDTAARHHDHARPRHQQRRRRRPGLEHLRRCFRHAPVSAGREIATVGANGVAGLAAAGTGTGVRATPESQANRDLVTIAHSATNNIVQFNSVSCNAGGLHTEQQLPARLLTSIRSASPTTSMSPKWRIGIEQALGATGSQPISVNLYTLPTPMRR